ncbi:MAG TPA: spore maturation protein [Firmicutes bacterium]|nr:spore maturation protein [Bacillota bacterium]
MKYTALIIPLLFLILFIYALFRRVKLYDCFTEGVKGAVPLVVSLFPYLVSILILSELFEQSGLSARLTQALSPVFSFLGIPPEIGKLVLVKPFSGSGSTALLSEILASFGADSYIGRCACVAYGSSETVFFVSAVYFAGSKKKLAKPILIALIANFFSLVLGCLLCRIL